ncbi:DUF445 domain-containing protein [Mobilicoccus caccae]|uniref:Membrane protein n=1 Tax=Mobilicoccus caccae TaxID=1859295 RepID=A0ABQ6IMW6_9MICO|nr:DUF445 domain-containing protein [Mobilicoccus caccae]GMA39265.1 membrane protein [Mobilicoccus caccae]
MTSIALTAADESRRRGLVRMRAVATSLFVLAIVVFVLTMHRDGWLGYVNATAEAAMVGALADWFAVTALFRHPLGIPIPHTALVPRKKDVFAKSLEDFVAGHFLTGEAARERLAGSEAAARAGRWLADPANSERVVVHASALTRRALEHVTDEEMQAVLEHSVMPRLVREPVAPLAGTLLGQVVEDDVHRHLVDLVVVEAHDWLLDNPDTFASVVGERAPTWSPLWVNSMVVDRLHTEALRWVRDVRDTRDHRVRLAVDDLLRDLARNLREDPATMRRAEELKETFLTHPQTMDTAMSLWAVLRRTLVDAMEDPEGRLRTRLHEELVSLGERLQHDPDLRTRVERRAGDIIAGLVDTYGAELVPVISQVIQRWDGKEAAERIELHVGRDLQFIRINGTVVGGLAGFLIHALSGLAA